MEKTKSSSLSILRSMALIVVLTGAVASFILMRNTSRRNNSILLLVLFATWDLSPFIGLFIANLVAKQWLKATRRALYLLMMVISVGSLVIYSGVLIPPGAKPAFAFLIVPLISWLLIFTVIPIVAARSRRISRRNLGN